MEKNNKKAVLDVRMEIAALNVTSFTIYHDPGHGWLEVPIRLLSLLQLEQEITSFSYISRNGLFVYLEEDCDATVFCEAYKGVMGMSTDSFRQERI